MPRSFRRYRKGTAESACFGKAFHRLVSRDRSTKMLSRSICLCALVLSGFGAPAQSSARKEPELSPKQQAVMDHAIATLKSHADRHVAEGWSNAKKVAELLCRPAALHVLKARNPAVDRVFLGTDDPSTLNLMSDRRLTGSGEFRTPTGWQDFSFSCGLDPATGKVTSFQPIVSSKKP
jgi:hypothetical protein